MLVQRAFPHGITFGIPGRLYLDGEPIEVRSEAEARLVAALISAEIHSAHPEGESGSEAVQLSPDALVLSEDIKQVLSRGPEENIRAILDQVVRWVQSPEYVRFAAEAR